MRLSRKTEWLRKVSLKVYNKDARYSLNEIVAEENL